MGMGCRGGGGGGAVAMHVCVSIYKCVFEGRGQKVIKIQWLGEREEGGQRGTEDGILSLYAPHRLSLSQHDSSVNSF